MVTFSSSSKTFSAFKLPSSSSSSSPLPCLASFSRGKSTQMEAKPRALQSPFPRCRSRSPPRDAAGESPVIALQEWQSWGSDSPVPSVVERIVEDLRGLEADVDEHMSFGGLGGKLQGDFKAIEDKKHRATYKSLGDSEQKLQFFSARQIACRLLGSRGYLCPKCWLALEDCMCQRLSPCQLWPGIRFWVYMHPKDFLRQNNTGKLLWQLFGVRAATLCLFGIAEHEDIMWDAFKIAGNNKVWCLYPNKNAEVRSVEEAFGRGSSPKSENSESTAMADSTLNFVLIDGTWNNSAAMVRRLKDRAKLVWGVEDIPCISLSTGASSMHKLRPQPSWDRTCTAAAAVALLSELQELPRFAPHGLDKQAEAVEDGLVILLDALTTRRLRMGRSITRKARHSSDIC